MSCNCSSHRRHCLRHTSIRYTLHRTQTGHTHGFQNLCIVHTCIRAQTLCDKQRSVSRFENKKSTTKNFVHISVFFHIFFSCSLLYRMISYAFASFFENLLQSGHEQRDAVRYFVSVRSTVYFVMRVCALCAKSININVLFSHFPCGQQHFDVIFMYHNMCIKSSISPCMVTIYRLANFMHRTASMRISDQIQIDKMLTLLFDTIGVVPIPWGIFKSFKLLFEWQC